MQIIAYCEYSLPDLIKENNQWKLLKTLFIVNNVFVRVFVGCVRITHWFTLFVCMVVFRKYGNFLLLIFIVVSWGRARSLLFMFERWMVGCVYVFIFVLQIVLSIICSQYNMFYFVSVVCLWCGTILESLYLCLYLCLFTAFMVQSVDRNRTKNQ